VWRRCPSQPWLAGTGGCGRALSVKDNKRLDIYQEGWMHA